MKTRHFLILMLALMLVVSPAYAGTKYMWGIPELSAYISGTNEFAPEEEGTVTIVIDNTGLNTLKIVQSDIIDRDYKDSDAKVIKATLESEGIPVTVKSDTQFVGDIPAGSSASAEFTIKVDKDAPAGEYALNLRLDYQSLELAEQYGSDTMRYFLRDRTEDIPVTITISSDVKLSVLDVKAEHVNVGTEGYVFVTIRNNGMENATNAVASIARHGTSPVQPTDGSVYIGDFGQGAEKTIKFKVAVSSEAEALDYPMDISVSYNKENKETATSSSETFSVPVGGKIDFEIISEPVQIATGEKKVLSVTYKNTGAAKVYNAQARISAVDPFTSNDDTAYLGDIEPGDTAVARFEVKVDGTATEKMYGLDSEIRYRDALDNSQISDTIKVELEVIPKSGLMTMVTNPIIIGVVMIIIIGGGYYIYKKRKENEQ